MSFVLALPQVFGEAWYITPAIPLCEHLLVRVPFLKTCTKDVLDDDAAATVKTTSAPA